MKRAYLSEARVNFRVPEYLRKELERESQYRLLSVSAIVRETLAARYQQSGKQHWEER